VSAQSPCPQKVVEVLQGSQGCARFAKVHADTRGRIEHPGRHDGDDAGLHLDMHEASRLTAVGALDPHPATEESVPAVMNDAKLPDMGRMDG
jgi:hypothetical protein